MNYADHIRTIEDFPEPGILFYDIAPLLGNGAIFANAIHDMAEPLRGRVNQVVGLDARGFVFGAAMALELGVGLTMVRKAGKLPGETIQLDYALEYGTNTIELQTDTLGSKDKVVLVDDVIATGGTAVASVELVRRTGATIVEFCSAIDLPSLGGSELIKATDVPVRSLVSF
ncbi:MAG: adenine phosphoribosyltransferase [Candidatus Saccharimonadales bacterium]